MTDQSNPAPTDLRDRYAAAIASYDHAVGHATDPAPGDHHHGQADAVLAVRDQELEQLRAQVTRVRQLAERWRYTSDRKGGPLTELRAALNPQEQQPADHQYLSTGCLHDRHDYCQSMTGLAGAKRPAECKFCQAACVCPCHKEQS